MNQVTPSFSISSIPQLAAEKGAAWSLKRRIADWMVTQNVLKPFPSTGPHGSNGLVFPIGKVHWERQITGSSSTAERFFSRDDLFEIKSLLKQLPKSIENLEAYLKLVHFIGSTSYWTPAKDIEELLNPLNEPSLSLWLRNNRGSSPLLPDERTAVLKVGVEAFFEFAPALVARSLGLHSSLVPTTLFSTMPIQVSFEGTNFQDPPSTALPLVTIVQPNVDGGVKPTQLVQKDQDGIYNWPKEILDRVTLQHYQEVSLFAAITKQNDLHWNNAYLVEAGNQIEIRLFDIGRSLLVPGVVGYAEGTDREGKEYEASHKLALRTFLMTWPSFDLPLTEEIVKRIILWNPETLKSQLKITPLPTRSNNELTDTLQDLRWEQSIPLKDDPFYFLTSPITQKKIRQLEEKAEGLFAKTITEEQWNGLEERLLKIQELARREKTPTMREIYEECFPFEMEFISLYEKVLGRDKGVLWTGATSIEQVLQQGLEEKKLTEEEVASWKERLTTALKNPHFKELHDWVYP